MLLFFEEHVYLCMAMEGGGGEGGGGEGDGRWMMTVVDRVALA